MTEDRQTSLSSSGLGRNPASLVLFALGMAEVPPHPALPGPALVQVLGDLGVSEAAARSTVLRLRRRGWLLSQRQGRTVGYSPGPAVLAGHRRRRAQFTEGPTWGGSFHALLVAVPEHRRSFRDELRRAATQAGYRTLQSGLLIAPSDRTDELGGVLDHVPPGASVTGARLELAPEDARRVAADLWNLADLGVRYRVLAAEARAASLRAEADPPTGADAVRALAAAALPLYEAVGDDPGLPPGLLPPGWPSAELGAALGQALDTFMPEVSAHVARLRDRYAGPAGPGGHKQGPAGPGGHK